MTELSRRFRKAPASAALAAYPAGMEPLDARVKHHLTEGLVEIGSYFKADVVAVVGPIVSGLDMGLRNAIERLEEREDSIVVILDTPGGVVEVVERMVGILRHIYTKSVTVLVPDRAMSAGTILALSADRIFMDYFSCLGPIDPQIERDGKLVPALSYIQQYERLNRKAEKGELSTAEYALLDKLDLGELYQFEQARELSIELLIKWLSRYKFKDWDRTETRKEKVTEAMKKDRAKEIAKRLNATERWHSHGRAIDMKTLQDEVGLKIEDVARLSGEIQVHIRSYFELLRDYMRRQELLIFVHSKNYF